MEANPYLPPQVAVAKDEAGEVVLAPRWRRLVAIIIDTLLVTLLWIGAGELITRTTGITLEAVSSSDTELWPGLLPILAETGEPLDFAVGFAMFLLLQGGLLWWRQQTIGKVLLGIRIADSQGRPAGFVRILVRELPGWLLPLIPYGTVCVLLNPLLIFGRQHRCGHDWLAGTQVLMVR